MVLSHSKLQTILTNPMDYYLSYKQGIKLKQTKPYFLTGSAVHWGLEHNTEYLDDFPEANQMGDEKFQAEAMLHGFFYRKEEVMKEVMGGETPIDELHELNISADLPSISNKGEMHKFVGIIDLLYLTEKGFVLVDYKTSSSIPDFDKYFEQLYRYIFELKSNFPEMPIYRIGVINLVKSKIKRIKNESIDDYKRRYREQYEKDYSHLINVHMFDTKNVDDEKMKRYIENLRVAADLAESIDKNNLYYYDAEGAKNPYPSVYLPIYNKEDKCFLDYKIKDTYFDEIVGKIQKERDCVELDMEVVEPLKRNKILNKYGLFKIQADLALGLLKVKNKEELFKELKDRFICDENLLENYWYIYNNVK